MVYDETECLTSLGQQTSIPSDPDAFELEVVPNRHIDAKFYSRFTCPEFTSLCPVTGQPDFATIIIDYAPTAKLIESKSLKLYLFSFRNHGAFHEDCTVSIGKKLLKALEHPYWIRVCGFWYPRGGIPIDVRYEVGEIPADMPEPPEPGVATYQPRVAF